MTDTTSRGLFHARADFVHPLPLNSRRPILKRECAYGKGTTVAEAEHAAVAEAVELYSATYRGDEHMVLAKLDDLDAISPESIMLFSMRQYRNRRKWNATHTEMHWIPKRFDATREIEWVPARSLLTGDLKYVPSACVYLWYPPGVCEYYYPDSNGCAAGSTAEDAVLRALLECIERDSLAIWWYNRVPRPAIHLESWSDSNIWQIVQAFSGSDRRVWLLDVTSDLDVPSYVAVATKLDGSEMIFAAAAHVSAKTAAFKALAELAQIAFWSSYAEPNRELAEWLKVAKLGRQWHFRPSRVVECPVERTMLAGEAVKWCVDRLHAVGIEPFWIDLTRPEIGIPAARVIAPGLRHFWA